MTIPRIGLVNVVAGREVAPEFVQGAARRRRWRTPSRRCSTTAAPRRAAMLEGLGEVRAKLGTPGAAGRVAAIALATALP